MELTAITQPHGGTNLDALRAAAAASGIASIDVAGAYATYGGVQPLIGALEDALGADWPMVRKRWLIAFDYFRTEPIALRRLASLPKSKVRIHDGAAILGRRCIPKIPFHPKTFILRGPGRHVVLAGSGNLSRSGLTRGHELGLLVDVALPPIPHDQVGHQQCVAVSDWFDARWNAASSSADVLDRYEAAYEKQLSEATPTEDDTSVDPARGALTADQLRTIRACRHLWIETGNITKNRGPDQPGNQLMMKRMTRVFFGIPAADVPKDTTLLHLTLAYAGHEAGCTLSYSNNAMDKLTLPIPGAAVPEWDQETMLITKSPSGRWDLALGSAKEVATWRKASRKLAAEFTMAGGRAWGVF